MTKRTKLGALLLSRMGFQKMRGTKATAALKEIYDSKVPRHVDHYLYFATSDSAAKAAVVLQHRGFQTVERRGADGVSWLVLAMHEVVPTEEELTALRDLMERIALPLGGEYDGWEVQFRSIH